MANLVQGTYPVFTDIDGNPLEDGFIFIGEPGVDPIANPISVYWDEALSVPATNVRTKGGYPNNSGAPGRLFVAGTYSILVQNKRGTAIYAQATFFEAGAELFFNSTGSRTPIVCEVYIENDDTIFLTFNWEQIPKQATSIELVYGSGAFRVHSEGTSLSMDATFTEGSPIITGKHVSVRLTKVGAFAVFTPSVAAFLTSWGSTTYVKLT